MTSHWMNSPSLTIAYEYSFKSTVTCTVHQYLKNLMQQLDGAEATSVCICMYVVSVNSSLYIHLHKISNDCRKEKK